MAAILDFRHIGFSEEVEIVKFEFLDPENLGVDILQAIFNAHCSSYFQKNAFWRHIGRHFEKWRVATLGGCSILIKFFLGAYLIQPHHISKKWRDRNTFVFFVPP